MAHVGRTGLLQLLRGTGKPHETGRVPGSGACALVAYPSPSEPETPGLVDAHSCFGSAMASSTANAPSLSRRSLCRQSSAIRTGCANKRPSGSVRGATSNGCPYRDRQTSTSSPVCRPPGQKPLTRLTERVEGRDAPAFGLLTYHELEGLTRQYGTNSQRERLLSTGPHCPAPRCCQTLPPWSARVCPG